MIRKLAIVGLVLLLVGAGALGWVWWRLQPTRQVTYRVIDDLELRLDLFEPAERATTDGAAILLLFGGGWTTGGPRQFHAPARHLADRGMLAVVADYRVFGRHGTSPFEALDDARQAFRWMQDNAAGLGIRPDRIVVSGSSAGGQLAAAIGVLGRENPGPPPAALVLFNPVTDTSFEEWGATPGIAALFEGRGKEVSPRHHVQPGAPPTLILHGTDDRLVPFAQSETFCREMQRRENPCRLVPFQGAGHGFFNFPRTRYLESMRKVDDFLASQGLLRGPLG